MRKLRVTVRGTFPLMCDRMSDEVLNGLITGVRPQLKKDQPFDEKAATKIYREDDAPKGRIGLPVTMLYASLVEAGRMVPFQGRKMISTAKTTLLPSFLRFEDEFMPFPVPQGAPETPWVVDKRRGRLPDGTAVGLIRPKFKDWGFNVTIVVDNKSPAGSQSTIEALFSVAGKCQGLGSFRPNCKGPFGTFAVEKMEDITPQEWLDEEKSSKGKPAVEVDYSGTEENGEPVDAEGAKEAATGKRKAAVPVSTK